MLALDIEFLLDVCFAARSPSIESADWPPQPDRVFSALAASWGARGSRTDERRALLWLERQPPPEIQTVTNASQRTDVTVFVPPNDAAAANVEILPQRRRRQPRRFPAVTLPRQPGALHLRLIWPVAPAPDILIHLNRLASATSYLGHSSSLVRCHFQTTPETHVLPRCTAARNAPYPGRLAELEALHRRHLAGDANARPLAAAVQSSAAPEPAAHSQFGQNWIVLEYTAGARPGLQGAAEVGRVLRAALMSAWDGPIPEWLSGHQPEGAPSAQPHLAFVPMANVGFTYSDGAWFGIAIVPPRTLENAWRSPATQAAYRQRQQLSVALDRLGAHDPGANTLRLTLGRLGCVTLTQLEVPDRSERASLRPERYARYARHWTTATPIALDRHPKGPDAREEAAAIISESCQRAGLPAPDTVLVHKHAAAAGSPSAWPASGAPRWTGWARPGALAGRPLIHATLSFARPVRGPLLLGAGRFLGLGLCLPVAGGDGP
jgi:CRISPR-associated protein Csb2